MRCSKKEMRELKMQKRVVFGMLAAGMAVSVTACGNKIENYYEPGVIKPRRTTISISFPSLP